LWVILPLSIATATSLAFCSGRQYLKPMHMDLAKIKIKINKNGEFKIKIKIKIKMMTTKAK